MVHRNSGGAGLPALHLFDPKVEDQGERRYLVGLAIRAKVTNTGPAHALSPVAAVDHAWLKFDVAPIGDLVPGETAELLIRVRESSAIPPGQTLLGDFTVRLKYRDGEGHWRQTVTPARLGGWLDGGGMYGDIGVSFSGEMEHIAPLKAPSDSTVAEPRGSSGQPPRRITRGIPAWLPTVGRWAVVAVAVPAVLIFTKAGFDAQAERSKHESAVPHIVLSRSQAAQGPLKSASDQGGVGAGADVVDSTTGELIGSSASDQQARQVIEVHATNPSGAAADGLRIDVKAGGVVYAATSQQPGRVARVDFGPDRRTASIIIGQLPVGDEAVIDVVVGVPRSQAPSDPLSALGVSIGAVCRNCDGRAELQ